MNDGFSFPSQTVLSLSHSKSSKLINILALFPSTGNEVSNEFEGKQNT